MKPNLPDRQKAVIDCIKDGLTAGETAARLGMCRQTVDRYAKRSGVKFNRKPHKNRKTGPDKRASQMIALYRSGHTLVHTGAVFSVTRERVRQIITKYAGRLSATCGQSMITRSKRDRARAERNDRCLAKWGCGLDEYRRIRAIEKDMLAQGFGAYRTPRFAYSSQRNNARHRGIPWELTLGQWWSIWEASGKWEQRGRGQGYVMCRRGDAGPYAVGNVFIATARENCSDRRQKKSGLPMGVSLKRGRYVAHRTYVGVKKHYIGSFDTPEQAHAAYLTFTPPANIDESASPDIRAAS